MLNNAEEYQKMADTEERLWWYRILHLKNFSAIKKHFPSNNTSILDIGCGTGGFLNYLRAQGYENFQGVDISDHAIRFSAGRNIQVKKGTAAEIEKLFPENSFDVLVCSDVLCYYEPQELAGILDSWKKVLKPGGIVVVNMPSLQAFRGMHDVSVGIRQRISWPAFKPMLRQAGYTCLSREHWPFLLSPLIFFERWRQRRKLKDTKVEIVSDVSMPPGWLNTLLYWTTRWESIIPGRKWGSSLFVVMKK